MPNAALYKDSNGIWIYKDGVTDALKTLSNVNVRRSIDSNNVTLYAIDSNYHFFKDQLVTEIEKSSTANDFYSSISDFESTSNELFIFSRNVDNITRGLVYGSIIWRGMGERFDMGETAAIRTNGEDVWLGNDLGGAGGGDFIPLPTITGEQMEVVSDSVQDMPSGILTFTGNALNGETLTIGTKVYTFQTTLTDVDGNILIGDTTLETIDNIVEGLYPEPNGGKGITYAASMTMQPENILCINNGLTVVFSTATGSLGSTETLTNASFAASTFAAKTGSAVVEVEYLDSDGYEQEEVITLNGTTLVLSTFTDGIFVNDFYAMLTAESGTGTGNITVRKAGGTVADTYNMIGVGQNKSLVPKRMIPKGKTLILKGWDCSEVQGKRLIYRARATASHGVRRKAYHFIDNTFLKLAPSPQYDANERIPELSLFTISGWADQSAAVGYVSWWGILETN
jgi:uncharacterized protein YqkB